MQLSQLNRLIPFGKLTRLLVFISVVLQVIIISYNHLSGYYTVSSAGNFLIRVSYSSVLTLIAAYLIAYPDLFLIAWLNGRLSWKKNAGLRILVQLLLTTVLAVVAAVFITTLAHYIDPYEEGLGQVLGVNILITIVINIIMIIILEAWIYFNESERSEAEVQQLQKELATIKFEVLKSQINPHFMFNSLNVLSSLIDTDVQKAQDFIDEFAMVYRYVLETIEKQVVSLEEEIGFLRSYMFLQKIRYGESLSYDINVASECLNMLVPPLSLQTVVENAIKHNTISNSEKLSINIYADREQLLVENSLNPKISHSFSTGVGQTNLVKRYAMLGKEKPAFTMKKDSYLAKLPLIKTKEDEYSDS